MLILLLIREDIRPKQYNSVARILVIPILYYKTLYNTLYDFLIVLKWSWYFKPQKLENTTNQWVLFIVFPHRALKKAISNRKNINMFYKELSIKWFCWYILASYIDNSFQCVKYWWKYYNGELDSWLAFINY